VNNYFTTTRVEAPLFRAPEGGFGLYLFAVAANIILLCAATAVLLFVTRLLHWNPWDAGLVTYSPTMREVRNWLFASIACHALVGYISLQVFRSRYRISWLALAVSFGAWVVWLVGGCVLMCTLLLTKAESAWVNQGILICGGIVWVAINIAGAQLFAVARRLSLKPVSEITRDNPHDYFVYLRSFASDALESPDRSPLRYFTSIGSFLIPMLLNPMYLVGFRRRSPEEIILLKGIGSVCPVVAIGKPGETLSPLGASRVYAQHAQWQQVAQSLVNECRAIFLLPHATEGVIWEFSNLCLHSHPSKVSILLPHALDALFWGHSTKVTEHKALWESFIDALQQYSWSTRLPKALPAGALVMTFSDDWSPHIWLGAPSVASFRQIARHIALNTDRMDHGES
jgi:hypothetical protein